MDHSHQPVDTRQNGRQNGRKPRILKEPAGKRPRGTKNPRAVRKGVRQQPMRSCRRAACEENHTSEAHILPPPPKDITTTGEQALRVPTSLPSSPGPQLKRKCEEPFAEENSAQDPSIRHSSRKSARLQKRRDRASKAGSQQSHLISSPSSSFDSDRGRQEADLTHLKNDVPSLEASQNFTDQREPISSQADGYNPIQTWIESGNWPTDFAERGFDMARAKKGTKSSKKRQKTLTHTQRVRDRLVPKQYTPEYERWILPKGLDMSVIKGRMCVSEESKALCISLQKITLTAIKPSDLRHKSPSEVLESAQNRNEAHVIRYVTLMLVPLGMCPDDNGAKHVEHVVDEWTTDWDNRYVLAGPRLRPDLAIGLFSSAFTGEEIDKLNNYTANDNWTRFTEEMYFPFLMCEVVCGEDVLDVADRQNMHSSSVALRALLRLEQEADKYRPKKKLASLNGQILVFSISHDQKDARLCGHYALLNEEKWIYHRYFITSVNLYDGILTLHNFVQNLFRTYLPVHVQRLKDALAAFPEPGVLSSAPSEMTSTDETSQQNPQNRDADGFVVPGPPASALRNEEAATKQQMDMLLQRIDQMEQERRESKFRENKLEELIDELMNVVASQMATI